MIGGSRWSRRRTRWKNHRVRVIVLAIRHRALQLSARIRRWQRRRVRLVGGTLATSLGGLLLRSALRLWRLPIHGLVLVAWRRRRVLTWLLLRCVRIPTVGRQRLAIGAIELSIGRRLLTTVDGVCRNEGLSLSRNGSEDAFLGKALAVGASAILGLIKAGATNLPRNQS